MVPELSDSGAPKSEIDVLVSLFRRAQDKLKSVVLHPPGGTEASRHYRIAWAAQQSRQIDLWLRQLDAASADWIGATLPQVFADGVKRAETQAKEAGVRVQGSGFGGSFALADRRTLEVFAHDIHADLSAASKSIGNRAERLLRATAQQSLSEADIDRILAGGVIEGRPLDTIRTLREELRRVSGDEVAVKTKSGGVMNFEVGYYASMVARTRTRQATVIARHRRLKELGLDLVAIVGRISNNFCTAFLGEVFSLSGRSTKYPALKSLPSGGPPFHPNCTKSTRPFVEELASEKQLDAGETDEDQRKLFNVEPAVAQKRFKELQLKQQAVARYATTARQLFGSST